MLGNMKILRRIIPIVPLIAGLCLLARTPHAAQRNPGWYILFGLPLLGVGAAGLLLAGSATRARRIAAGAIVIVTGMLLAAFGATDGLLDPDNPWHMYNDPRPVSVTVGLVLAICGVGWVYTSIKSIGKPNQTDHTEGC
jgi:hypothetical protein